MRYVSRAASIVKEEGILALIKKSIRFLYNRLVGPLLSNKEVRYNEVTVTKSQKFRDVNPRSASQKDKPTYESGLISGIENYVEEGDSVVIVGGGWGVTAVRAAQKVGESGRVTVYEGSAKEVSRVKTTIKKNGVSEIVRVIHGIVADPIKLRGKSGGATHISPEEIPECDILELDCEGSETVILENLQIRPRVILVETHGLYQSPSSVVEEILKNNSYSIQSKEVAEKRMKERHISDDVYVLSAVQK